MMFIFNESAALYPSIYLGFNATSDQRFRYVQAILREAKRIARKFNPPLPIYAYTKIEYDPLKEIDYFYNDHDLCTTIRQPADLGIDGIIFWSSSRNITLRCPHIKTNMDDRIGINVTETVNLHDSCRKNKCSGNGKCILSTNTTCPVPSTHMDDYECECDYGFSGQNCTVATISTATP
ncbi:EGF-like domain protein [Ancylostoma caninum]|uniref:Hyaluronidase n=1 Tax=Ancylostoma caninum TaxID=29170 RepID=A0A368FV49_ANCCA|nr:EGF-like domain protein [Ancylostoma caninum]